MKPIISILSLFIVSSVFIKAQETGCLSGSCEDGVGKYLYANGYIYEGNFVKGIRSGLGKLTSPGGDVYDGMWENDQFSGQGSYVWADGSKYTGNGRTVFRTAMEYSFILMVISIQGISKTTSFMERENIRGPMALCRKVIMKTGSLKGNNPGHYHAQSTFTMRNLSGLTLP
jgi:hypothetical protein